MAQHFLEFFNLIIRFYLLILLSNNLLFCIFCIVLARLKSFNLGPALFYGKNKDRVEYCFAKDPMNDILSQA